MNLGPLDFVGPPALGPKVRPVAPPVGIPAGGLSRWVVLESTGLCGLGFRQRAVLLRPGLVLFPQAPQVRSLSPE